MLRSKRDGERCLEPRPGYRWVAPAVSHAEEGWTPCLRRRRRRASPTTEYQYLDVWKSQPGPIVKINLLHSWEPETRGWTCSEGHIICIWDCLYEHQCPFSHLTVNVGDGIHFQGPVDVECNTEGRVTVIPAQNSDVNRRVTKRKAHFCSPTDRPNHIFFFPHETHGPSSLPTNARTFASAPIQLATSQPAATMGLWPPRPRRHSVSTEPPIHRTPIASSGHPTRSLSTSLFSGEWIEQHECED